jgi:hypothetical protein
MMETGRGKQLRRHSWKCKSEGEGGKLSNNLESFSGKT